MRSDAAKAVKYRNLPLKICMSGASKTQNKDTDNFLESLERRDHKQLNEVI
jgi:hypothetical protein